MEFNPALEKFLKSIPLFQFVEAPEMMELLRLLRPVALDDGQVLFREGDPGNAIWVLGEGVEVSISMTPPGGQRPLNVATARGGETVGEMSLVDDTARSATAVVIKGGPAHEIEAVDFQVLREGYSPAAFKILRKIAVDLCRKLRATNDRIAPSVKRPFPAPALPSSPLPSASVIDEFPGFRRWPEVVKLALAQKLTLVEAEGTIFGEGESSDSAYFVLSGEVTVARGGKTLATLGPGEMFGLVAAIDQCGRSASCAATRPSRLLRLADADFDALFARGNRFAYHLVDLVARQLVTHLRDANALYLKSQLSPVVPDSSEEEEVIEGEELKLDLGLELEL